MTNILIITADYYKEIADEMLEGAKEVLDGAGASYDVKHIPGAFELPLAFSIGADADVYDGVVALGCVIKGETDHYDYVCSECSRGLMQGSLDYEMPLGFGVLTVQNREQAMRRAKRTELNKGAEAAKACLEMIQYKNTMLEGLK